MPRLAQFALFFTFMLLLVTGVHWYFWRRLVVGPALPAPWRLVAGVAIIVAAASLPLAMILSRALPQEVARVVVYPMFVYMGVMFLLFFALIFTDLGRLAHRAVLHLAHQPPVSDERRQVLARATAGAVAALVLGAGGFAVAWGLRRLVVRDVDVKLKGLPRSLDGLTIVQITDLHLGATRGRAWMQEVVDRVNALRPDVVAVTGDLVDGSVADLQADVAPLGDLRSTHGTFFVTGNHEYYSGADAWIAELRRIGVRVLRNERVELRRGADALDLAGVDDHEGRRLLPHHGEDVGKALAGRDPARPVVLLAHQPRAIHEAARLGAGLVLAGHTHGGQIWPMHHLARLQQPYVWGLHRHPGSDTQIYVSAGTGFWGPPMRLGSTAEITRVHLRSV
jgi:hypothetical protein